MIDGVYAETKKTDPVISRMYRDARAKILKHVPQLLDCDFVVYKEGHEKTEMYYHFQWKVTNPRTGKCIEARVFCESELPSAQHYLDGFGWKPAGKLLYAAGSWDELDARRLTGYLGLTEPQKNSGETRVISAKQARSMSAIADEENLITDDMLDVIDKLIRSVCDKEGLHEVQYSVANRKLALQLHDYMENLGYDVRLYQPNNSVDLIISW